MMIAGCNKECCWRKNLLLTSARFNNELSEALGYSCWFSVDTLYVAFGYGEIELCSVFLVVVVKMG